MTSLKTSRIPRRWRLLRWPLVWSFALAAFALAFWGFWTVVPGAPPNLTDAIYSTLQLFLLGGNLPKPLNWQLEIARFLAPGVMGYTATQALIVLFREQLTMLRLHFRRGHVVVCGLGRMGFKVSADFLRRGEKVVVIEEDSDTDWIAMSRSLGAIVLIGDATDAAMLDQARIQHARLLVAVCGNDGINVEVSIRAYELKRAGAAGSGPVLCCHIHIVEPDLRALFKEHHVFTNTGDRCRVALFNIYESSARLVMKQWPLDRERIGPDDPRVAHLVVIGFGLMGESLVLQAARSSHFANHSRLQVTVVDRDFAEQQRRFFRRYPGLKEVCDLTVLTKEADDAETLAEIAAICAEARTLPTVAICFDDDARGLSLALALLPGLKPLSVRILLRMTTDGGLTTLLDAGIAASRLGGLVKPFPVIGLSSESEVLIHREMDALAMAVHADYTAKHRKANDADDPALQPWQDLDEDLKDSCRQQADHIVIKLRAIGLTTEPEYMGEPVTAFTPDEVAILARMEHARWNAERFIAGWTFAFGDKDIERRTSPHLVEWDALPEEIREYDREAVRNIPHLVKMSGRSIYRVA